MKTLRVPITYLMKGRKVDEVFLLGVKAHTPNGARALWHTSPEASEREIAGHLLGRAGVDWRRLTTLLYGTKRLK